MSLLTDLQATVFKPSRSIGTIVAQCTIEEDHLDEVNTTEHPVEQGAEISDHAYKRASTFTIRAGWSNSGYQALLSDAVSLYNDVVNGSSNGFNYIQQQYNQLLALQASLQFFSVTTGKRVYQNVLMLSISALTNEKTEHALVATMRCKSLIVTQTSLTTISDSDLANPQLNGSTQNMGIQQPATTTLQQQGTSVVPSSGSVLSNLFGAAP